MDFKECYSDTVSSVAAAARSGNGGQVRRLIRRGFSLDSRDNRGWNALHEAAAAGVTSCVREILSAAAAGSSWDFPVYVNSLTHEGESVLYLAAQHGHLVVVRILLKANANINQPTNDLSCPLFAAVDGGHKEVVELLVRKGAEVNGTHTSSCWSCLHQTAYKGYSEILRTLVGVCNLEALDDHKITPLFVAAQYGQQQCLEILANAGASVNAQAEDLATPLMIASQEGHEGCVEALLEHGADPNLSCSSAWIQLPIHAASEFGHKGILQRLIAVTDRECDRGEAMVSPLYTAMKKEICLELLLKDGYCPDAQDCSDVNNTPSPLQYGLFLARNEPCSESVRLLIAAGASLTDREWLHALATDKPDLLQLILQYRWIPRPEQLSGITSRPERSTKIMLRLEELRELVCVALNQVQFAACWLPLLLTAGLEPSFLLQPDVLRDAESEVVNYLLEFLNWSTLSPPVRHILHQRQDQKTWIPHAHLECVPSLTHLCRLRVREMLGSDVLMTTAVVQQLPVPLLLQSYLQFKDIKPPTCTHTSTTAMVNCNEDMYQHKHVL
ncbi:ankyrin repeat and SOCS box protein 3 [Aplochiton taeniatus]